MKILVTGAGGFLGSRIASSLIEQGAGEVVLHYRAIPKSDPRAALRARFPEANVSLATGNIAQRGALAAQLEGVDCVIHAAAGMKGAAADMVMNTVVATRNFLDSCEAAHVKRIVLISSFAVYRTEQLARGTVLDEAVPLEPTGVERGPYGYAKLQQERLFEEYRKRVGFESVILRPGVIYGAGGGMSSRVGIAALGFFFSLGGGALLPLTYVDNCADAVAAAALRAPSGAAFNVVDDELPSCSQYLRRYCRDVQKLRVLRVPYPAFMLGARWLAGYGVRSGGQLPAVFTPYVVRSMYRKFRYSNEALKRIGWKPRVSTHEGMRITFEGLRKELAGR